MWASDIDPDPTADSGVERAARWSVRLVVGRLTERILAPSPERTRPGVLVRAGQAADDPGQYERAGNRETDDRHDGADARAALRSTGDHGEARHAVNLTPRRFDGPARQPNGNHRQVSNSSKNVLDPESRGMVLRMSASVEQLLREHGMQVTAQRLAVLRAVAERPHTSADDVVASVRARGGPTG